jgi:hypothetical protein
MALLTHVDYQSLDSWSFLSDYQRRQRELINIARAVYSAVKILLNSSPLPSDCESPLTFAMLATKPFADFLQKRKHVNPTVHLAFAGQMARLVPDNDWTEITKP